MIKILHNLCCTFLLPIFLLANTLMAETVDYTQFNSIGEFFEHKNINLFNIDKVEVCRINNLLLPQIPISVE